MSCVQYDDVGHFVRAPASLGRTEVRMLLDSGMGITIIDRATAESVGAVDLAATTSGQRMSGQLVTAPLVRLPQLTIGSFTVHDHVAGVVDLAEADNDDDDDSTFDGILGLDLFQEVVVTVDPGTRQLTIGDEAPDGLTVPVEVRREGRSVTVFAPVRLPSGRVVELEVDTGSGALILDDAFMPDCAVTADDPRIERLEGIDETGNAFVRRFISIAGEVGLVGAPTTTQRRPRVMFCEIIHDGLLGADYLSRFVHSFDVARSRIVLRPLRPS